MSRKLCYAPMLAVCLGALACAPPMVLQRRIEGTKTAEAKHVIVLKSSDNPLLEQPLWSFVEQVPHQIDIFTLTSGTTGSAVAKALGASGADLVFTLGLGAATLVADHEKDIPVLFAMVPNAERHGLTARSNVMGVGLESPSVSDFMQFKMVAPKMKDVLVIYSEASSGPAVRQSKKDLVPWGVELLLAPAEDQAGVVGAYNDHRNQVDAVWLQNDPVVMNPRAFGFLRESTIKDRLVFVTSLSERFAEAGALASVSLDFSAVGSQAANMANMVLEGRKTAAEIGVQPPVGGLVTLNQETARKIGISVPEEVLPFLNRVIADTEQPSR